MFTKKDRKIANLTQMVENRDEIITRLQIQKDELKAENTILIAENKIGNKAIITLEEIAKLARGNKYGNEKIFFDNIKELIRENI